MVKNNLNLERIWARFKREGINYCVLRNYNMNFLGNKQDIDILVLKRNLNSVISILKKETFIVFKRKNSSHLFAFGFFDTGECLYLDIVTEFYSDKIFRINFEDEVLKTKRKYNSFFVPSFEYELIFLLLHCLFDNNKFSDKYKRDISYLLDKINLNHLDNTFATILNSKTLSKQVLSYISSRGYSNLFGLKRAILSGATRYSLLKLVLLKFKRYILKIKNQFNTQFNPLVKGATIAILGPDGSGKTTLIEGIKENFIFPCRSIYMGGRESIIPFFNTSDEYLSDKEKQKRAEKQINDSGEIKSFTKYVSVFFGNFIIYLEYLLRYYLRVFIPYYTGRVILFDRYIYDYFRDKKRINTFPFFKFLITKSYPVPDITIFLENDPEVIFKRKKEMNINTLKKQFETFKYIKENVKNAQAVITINKEQTRSIAMRFILEAYITNMNFQRIK